MIEVTHVQVAVVGGGLAGLFTACELIRRGVDDVIVVDRATELGGMVRSIRRDGYTLEPAAGTLLLPHPHLTPFVEGAGAEVVPAAPAAATRYVYTRGRLVAVPTSPMALLAPLVPVTAKLRAVLEPFVRASPESVDESLDSFLRRRLGERLGGILAWVAASGVFAGDPRRLSARAAFPALPALEDDAGSLVRGGLRRFRSRNPGAARPASHLPAPDMSGLAQALAGSLGDRFRAGFEVASVTRDSSGWAVEGTESIRADQVVLAVSPDVAAKLVGGELSDTLSRSVTAPVVVVGLGGPSGDVPVPAGFGVLTGPEDVVATRGILFESSYAPGRAPEGHGLMKVIAGGAVRPDVAGWSDDQILESVVEEASLILGRDVDPSFTEIVRHLPGIPQYEMGHLDWLAELDRLAMETPGLHLTGWGYRGVGVAHVATDAAATARRIADGTD